MFLILLDEELQHGEEQKPVAFQHQLHFDLVEDIGVVDLELFGQYCEEIPPDQQLVL